MRVFISSTFEDLKGWRAAVIEALHRMKQEVGRMEVFPASDDESLKACQSEISRCDYFIGIYAHRYGQIQKYNSKSMIDIEYGYAKKCKLPIFCFLVDKDYPWQPTLMDDGLRKEKLESFKTKIKKEHLVDHFTTPEDLSSKVATTMISHLIGREKNKKANAEDTPPASIPEVTIDKYECSCVHDGAAEIYKLIQLGDGPALSTSYYHIYKSFINPAGSELLINKNRSSHLTNVMNNVYSLLTQASRSHLRSIELYLLGIAIIIHGQNYDNILTEWANYSFPTYNVATVCVRLSRALHANIIHTSDSMHDRTHIEGHGDVSLKFIAAIGKLGHDLDFYEYLAPKDQSGLTQSMDAINEMLSSSHVYINRYDQRIAVHMDPRNYECQNVIFRLRPILLSLLNGCNKVFRHPQFAAYRTLYKSITIKLDNDALKRHSKQSNLITIYTYMPMMVLRVNVHVGDVVTKGDYLFIGEADKCEQPVYFWYDYGTVRSIYIRPGDSIARTSQPIMVIELARNVQKNELDRSRELNLPNEICIVSLYQYSFV